MRKTKVILHCTGALLLLGGILCTVSVSAQPPGGMMGGGMMGGGMRMGPRPLTAIQVPMEALDAGLKLNASQKTQVKALQEDLKKQREKMMPAGGMGGMMGGGGGRPDFTAMRANFEKLAAAGEAADKKLQAQLNPTQKKALPALLKNWGTVRSAGIPLETYGSLKLTDAQIKQLATVVEKNRPQMGGGMMGGRPGGGPPGGGGRPGGPPMGGGGMGGMMGGFRQMMQKTHDESMKVLNANQRKTVEAYEKAHPRPQRGGMGMMR